MTQTLATRDLTEWDQAHGVIGTHQSARDEIPDQWTTDHLAKRLVEAADTIERMPGLKKPRLPGDHWPQYQYEFADRRGWNELPEKERRARDYEALKVIADRPNIKEISQAEQCQSWLRELREWDKHLGNALTRWVVCRCKNIAVSAMCAAEGWEPPSFYRWRERGLKMIVNRLNRLAIPVF